MQGDIKKGNSGKIKGFQFIRGIRFERIIYILIYLSFLLPFLSAKECGKDKKEVLYFGFDLFTKDSFIIYLVLFVILLTLFIITFSKKKIEPPLNNFFTALKFTIVSLTGFLIYSITTLQFIFETIKPKLGFIVYIICFSFLYIKYCVISLNQILKSGLFKKEDWKITSILLALVNISLPLILMIVLKSDSIGWELTDFAFVFFPIFVLQAGAILGIKLNKKWAYVWSIIFSAITILILLINKFAK